MLKKLILSILTAVIISGSVFSQSFRTLSPVADLEAKHVSKENEMILKGIDEVNNKRYEDAIQTFNEAIASNDENAIAYINCGVAYYMNGDMNAAKTNFTKALDINGALHWAWFGLGHVSLNIHKPKEALKSFGVAKELNKSDEKYAFMYGVALKEMGYYDKAITVFEKRVDNETYKSDALVELGNVYALKFEFEKSIEYYEKAEESGASSDLVSLNMAKVSATKNENDVKDLDEYINSHPDDSKGLVMRGNYHFKNNEFKKAIQDFSSAIQVNETEVNAYNGRAAAYIKIAKYEEALEDCNQAIDMDPNFSIVYYNRGIVKEMLRDVEGACYDWEQSFLMGVDKAEEYLNSATCHGE